VETRNGLVNVCSRTVMFSEHDVGKPECLWHTRLWMKCGEDASKSIDTPHVVCILEDDNFGDKEFVGVDTLHALANAVEEVDARLLKLAATHSVWINWNQVTPADRTATDASAIWGVVSMTQV
jgi:hypothetical protein